MEQIIKMPKLSSDMEKGVLAAWLKQKGDTIEKNDVLFEVETAKVVSEVEATASGVLTEVYCEEGDEVAVDEPVAVISWND
ncbi:MAG: biotin/lipoyl-containing protein [Roseburia sp.]